MKKSLWISTGLLIVGLLSNPWSMTSSRAGAETPLSELESMPPEVLALVFERAISGDDLATMNAILRTNKLLNDIMKSPVLTNSRKLKILANLSKREVFIPPQYFSKREELYEPRLPRRSNLAIELVENNPGFLLFVRSIKFSGLTEDDAGNLKAGLYLLIAAHGNDSKFGPNLKILLSLFNKTADEKNAKRYSKKKAFDYLIRELNKPYLGR